MYPMIIALLVLLAPSIAHAADAAPAAAAPTGAAGVILAVTALVTALGGVISAWRSRREAQAAQVQATQAQTQSAAAQTTATTAATAATTAVQVATAADTRATAAAAWADRHANAMRDGVVCVVTYPGVTSPCRRVLEVRGWTIRVYEVTSAELAAGRLLPGDQIRGDIAAADAVVFEGAPVEAIAALADDRAMRDSIRSGASVVLATGGENHRYDLRPWGVFALATNTALTTEAAVVASLARRADIAALQGVRPGQLAAARQALIGGAS